MTSQPYSPLLHRWADSTVCLAIVTLTFGALVTTKNAGMAFADWPTSDGYLMVTYPWLRDYAVNWGKFLEHGHRLAGMLIGMWSIALVVTSFVYEKRRWVRWLSVAILLGVICQGLLGGFRVQLNDRGLAMLHGMFAAVVFSLMGAMALVTNRKWFAAPEHPSARPMGVLEGFAAASVGMLSVQYIFGSLIRHKGTGLHEHLALGILVLIVVLSNVFFTMRSDNRWIRRSALLLLLAVLGQILLGLSTWVLKYGFPPTGYVAIADSTHQVITRTSHMVWGAITLMTAVVYTIKVFRVSAVSSKSTEQVFEIQRSTSHVQLGGAQ